MNAAGILGGIVSTSVTPIIEKYFGWMPALGAGAAVAMTCAGLWLVIGRRPRMQPVLADSHSENRS